MNKLQDWLGEIPARCALLLYLSVGLFQFLIIPTGLETWTGIHWLLAVVCAAVLAWIPVMGQGLGFATAVAALNWPVALAAALFLWPLWFAGIIFALRRFTGDREGSGKYRSDGGFERSLQAFRDRGTAANADAPTHAGTAQ